MLAGVLLFSGLVFARMSGGRVRVSGWQVTLLAPRQWEFRHMKFAPVHHGMAEHQLEIYRLGMIQADREICLPDSIRVVSPKIPSRIQAHGGRRGAAEAAGQ
jgi:hypothetical protein